MHKLIVQNFGPITNCEIELNELTLFIGPQSSGKSTISKLFFFFLNIRDEFVNFALDQVDNTSEKTQIREFSKVIRKRFIEFWGPTPLHPTTYIRYEYDNLTYVEIKLDSAKHRYVDPVFSPSIESELSIVHKALKSIPINEAPSSNLFNSARSISIDRVKDTLVETLRDRAKSLFFFDREIFFIPAGRSLLSTLSDQLQYIHPHHLDYPMRVFIDRINKSKAFFGKSLADLIKDRALLEKGNVWFSAVRRVEHLVNKILRAEYIHDKEGGKLYVNNKTYTKLSFASSGQQESIWILLSLFLVVLEKVDAIMFIEEPEAHLFPTAQKDMVELLCFLSHSMGTNFVITTHSPYILSALNNHIYAASLGKSKKNKVSNIISQHTWIDFNRICGYFISQGTLNDLCDASIGLLKTELIDEASSLVNQEYDALFQVEVEN